MTYIMSIDVGDKRVGVAIGTLSPKSLAPHAIYERSKGQAEEQIIKLINEKKIENVVVGLPLSDDGASNEQCIKIERFCHRIQRRCNVKIIFVDEYATSYEAVEKLKEMKQQSLAKRQKKHVDDISACIILEGYLNTLSVEDKLN